MELFFRSVTKAAQLSSINSASSAILLCNAISVWMQILAQFHNSSHAFSAPLCLVPIAFRVSYSASTGCNFLHLNPLNLSAWSLNLLNWSAQCLPIVINPINGFSTFSFCRRPQLLHEFMIQLAEYFLFWEESEMDFDLTCLIHRARARAWLPYIVVIIYDQQKVICMRWLCY